MTKLKKFIINALLLTVTALFMRTVSMYFNAYISEKVGAECIGLYTLIMSVYGFSVTLATSGVNLAATRTVSAHIANGDYKGANDALKTALVYSLSFGALSFFLLGVFSAPIGIGLLGDARTVRPIRVMAISMPPIAVSACLCGYFTAVRRSYKSAAGQIFEMAVKISLMSVLLLKMMPSGIEYACLALVLSGVIAETLSALFLFILCIFEKRRCLSRRENTRKKLRESWSK